MTGTIPTVLIIEDDDEIRKVLRRYFERDQFAVFTASSGSEALTILGEDEKNTPVDAIVLDLGLPDIEGIEILKTWGGIPTLVLTARTSMDDRILGLQKGAADYVAKPFSPTEIVLRIRAILRRSANVEETVLSFGGGRLLIDESGHFASLDKIALELTPTEWGILTALCSTPGRVYSRYELINRVRGYEFSGYERTIDSHVKNLRNKLQDKDNTIIETVTGVGYKLRLKRDH